MSERTLIVTALVAFVALAGCDDPAQPGLEDGPRPGLEEAQRSQRDARIIPGRYIVVLTDEVTDPPGVARGLTRAHGLELRHTYATALKGFAAVVPEGRLNALRADPRVRYVTPDRVDELYQEQTVPTGIARIGADLNAGAAARDPVEADIAILDTGIDSDHPDLNVHTAVAFAGGNAEDGLGHGTHVAGTAAARDDGAGVVGVAPGARIWAVKVCKNSGFCDRSDIIAGIDYVAQNAAEIEVANMSLGGPGSDDGDCGGTNDDPEHTAICGAVEAGVVFVVAAGNGRDDAAGSIPAAYDEVITVSALADFDGRPGGTGSPTCGSDADDSFADFSNWGADVDVMAPGVCIQSTWKQGGYNMISGTSMAAPHVTGTVALYVAANGRDVDGDGDADGVDVGVIRSALTAGGIDPLDPCGLATFDDPDGSYDPIVFANDATVGGDGSCGAPVSIDGDIAIANVSGPSSAQPGTAVPVTVTVENVGTVAVENDVFVTLVSDNATGDTEDDIAIGTATIAGGLAAGGSIDLPFDWNTVGAAEGQYTLTATHGLNDVDPSNDRASTIVILEGDPVQALHVGNLDRASTKDGGGTWTAWARVTVHDAGHGAVAAARVEGIWDNSGNTPSLPGECVTDSDGRCEVSYPGIPNRDGNIVFRVQTVHDVDLAYDAAENHDPDGNSDGTAIRVFFSNSDDYKK